MGQQVSEQLIDDHAALDELLKQLQTALRDSDLQLAHNLLDLFWAKLAVHIRAEHLHLFPTVLGGLENAALDNAAASSLDEAQLVVVQLRQDHEFFMHQLALAVEIMRELLTLSDPLTATQGLNNVKEIVLEVEQRLVRHNETEETQIYRWATTILNSEEQAQLATLITTELQKHPSRFTVGIWCNEYSTRDDD